MKFLLLVAALAVTGLASDAAPAATYTVDVTANPFRQPGVPGLQTRAWNLSGSGARNFTGATYSVDLDTVGDTVTVALYSLVHFNTAFAPNHAIERATSATFDFGGFGTSTLTGISQGVKTVDAEFAVARDFTTGSVDVGLGRRILISIADVVFGTDGTRYLPNKAGLATVEATFTLTAVPLPASAGLGLAGLGALGLLAARRRRRRAA